MKLGRDSEMEDISNGEDKLEEEVSYYDFKGARYTYAYFKSVSYKSLSIFKSTAEETLNKKIKKIESKLKNPAQKEKLSGLTRQLFIKIPANLDGELELEEEDPIHFKDIMPSINNTVFLPIFYLILDILEVEHKADEKKDSMGKFAESFEIYCKYKECKKTRPELNIPLENIFGDWGDFKYDIQQLKKSPNKMRFLPFLNFITTMRNFCHGDWKKKDIICKKETPGNFVSFVSIYQLALYGFEDILDHMLEYIDFDKD
jgi:hypothetical protein